MHEKAKLTMEWQAPNRCAREFLGTGEQVASRVFANDVQNKGAGKRPSWRTSKRLVGEGRPLAAART